MAGPSFQPDAQIAEIAEAYALDAIDLAARNFGIQLDWSEDSIRQVEQMLGRLHDEMAGAQPPEEAVWTFAKAFGSYVGEVLRRHHGGRWGMVNLDGESFAGLQQAGGSLCWPWGKAHKRLVKGPADNLWHYYRILVQSASSAEGRQSGLRRRLTSRTRPLTESAHAPATRIDP
jgi:hypothetical protein